MIWHQMFKLKTISPKKSLTHLLFGYSNLYLMSQLHLTCGQRQLISTDDSDQLESSLATLVTVHD